MPTTLSVSSGSVLPSPSLRYDPKRISIYSILTVDGFFTELGRQLANVQGLSATEGIQLLKTVSWRQPKTPTERPSQLSLLQYTTRDKPFFDDECRVALRQYEEALQDATSHVAKYFLKRF
ncbi:TPA: hypothetical protein ACH3X1_015350 [Trebouxia sp. C0004]